MSRKETTIKHGLLISISFATIASGYILPNLTSPIIASFTGENDLPAQNCADLVFSEEQKTEEYQNALEAWNNFTTIVMENENLTNNEIQNYIKNHTYFDNNQQFSIQAINKLLLLTEQKISQDPTNETYLKFQTDLDTYQNMLRQNMIQVYF